VAAATEDVLTDVLDATIGPPLEVASVEEEHLEDQLEEPVVILNETFHGPIGSEASSEVPSTEETAAVDAVPSGEEPAPRPRPMPRGPAREAFSGFAAALARAQDPTTEAVAAEFEELPGSRETADAIAAYRRDVEAGADVEAAADVEADADVEPAEAVAPGAAEAQAVEPTVEPIPEPIIEAVVEAPAEAVAEPPLQPLAVETPEPAAEATSVTPAGYSTETPEPDWIAEEDLIISAGDDPSVRADALLRQAVVERTAAVPVMAEPPVAPDEEITEAIAVETAHGTSDIDAEPVSVVEAEAEPEPGPIVEPEPTGALEAPIEREPEPEPVPMAPDEPTAQPAPVPWPEPDLEPESPVADSRLTPIEIAAEPPAADDSALLAEPPRVAEPPFEEPPFEEPPILPPEPAFWESGAGTRAPFAIAQPEPWQPSVPEPVSVEVQPAGEPSAGAQADSPRPALEPEPSLEPRPLSPAALAGRAAAARRQPRGPAARALRRLRYLLD
jgi:hypothetical protein